MAETNKTISQIRIGDENYNIQDAVLRESVNNLQDNTVTFHNFYFSDWSPKWKLRTNSEINNEIPYNVSNRGCIKIYIMQNKLYNMSAVGNSDSLSWVNTGPISNTPSTVEQCAIFLQYRFRVSMPKSGYFSSQILRKGITNSNYNVGLSSLNGFEVQNTTKNTYSMPLTPASGKIFTLQCSNYYFDRAVKSNSGANGWMYKIGINDLNMPGYSSTVYPFFTGICCREVLIVQGNSTKPLTISELPVDDNYTDPGDNQNYNTGDVTEDDDNPQ